MPPTLNRRQLDSTFKHPKKVDLESLGGINGKHIESSFQSDQPSIHETQSGGREINIVTRYASSEECEKYLSVPKTGTSNAYGGIYITGDQTDARSNV